MARLADAAELSNLFCGGDCCDISVCGVLLLEHCPGGYQSACFCNITWNDISLCSGFGPTQSHDKATDCVQAPTLAAGKEEAFTTALIQQLLGVLVLPAALLMPQAPAGSASAVLQTCVNNQPSQRKQPLNAGKHQVATRAEDGEFWEDL